MLSEEEFAVFQQKMNDISQKNFQLKEQLLDLDDDHKEYIKLTKKIEELEKKKEDSLNRHTESLSLLQEELKTLKEKLDIQVNKKNQEINNKYNELNDKINELTQKNKEKEEEIEKMRTDARNFPETFKAAKKETNIINNELKRYGNFAKFMAKTRGYPMYLEDINMKIYNLNMEKMDMEATYNENVKRMADLDRFIDMTNKKIKEKNTEYALVNSKQAVTNARIESTQAEIQQTEENIKLSKSKLKAAKADTVKFVETRQKQLEDVIYNNEELKKEIIDKEAEINSLNEGLDKELARVAEEAKEFKVTANDIKVKIVDLKENGMDPSTPRVDLELGAAIEKIKAEYKQLREEKAQLDKEIIETNRELDTVEFQLKSQALKESPSAWILQSPEFQQKHLLLEELVIQNKELEEMIISYNQEIAELKKDTGRVRQILEKYCK